MNIVGIVWLRDIVDKLIRKHQVETYEVEEVLENNMAKSKSKPLPKFDSLVKLVEFFETHDMGDYVDVMPEAHFDIDLKHRTHIVALDEDLAERVTAIARAKRVSSKSLINKWLREKVVEQTKAAS